MKNDGKWRFRARLVAAVDLGRGALGIGYLIAGLVTGALNQTEEPPLEEWFVGEQLAQENFDETAPATWSNVADVLGPVSYTALQIWFSNRLLQATRLGAAYSTALRYSQQYHTFSRVVLALIVCCPVLVVAVKDNLASPPLVWVLLAFWLVSMLERLLYVFVVHQFLLEVRQQRQFVVRQQACRDMESSSGHMKA